MFTPLQFIFYIFAMVAVGAATFVVTSRNPVHSVLALVVTFFAMASTWMMLRAEFLALVLVLVYVGAVMTLFLFVIMMLNIDIETGRSRFIRYFPFGFLLVAVFTGLIIIAMGPQYFGLLQMPEPMPVPADFSNTHALGLLLFSDYAYAFEVAGVLLLTAIIAAISLTFRGPRRRKVQQVSEQTSVEPSQRVRLIKMTADLQPKKS